MNRPIFKKGDVIVHFNTGTYCTVLKARKDSRVPYNILIHSQRNYTEWMDSKYYVLASVYESPLYQALN